MARGAMAVCGAMTVLLVHGIARYIHRGDMIGTLIPTVLASSCPTMLAHGPLITSDAFFTFFVLASAMAVYAMLLAAADQSAGTSKILCEFIPRFSHKTIATQGGDRSRIALQCDFCASSPFPHPTARCLCRCWSICRLHYHSQALRGYSRPSGTLPAPLPPLFPPGTVPGIRLSSIAGHCRIGCFCVCHRLGPVSV